VPAYNGAVNVESSYIAAAEQTVPAASAADTVPVFTITAGHGRDSVKSANR
jgi:hypothetical protein